MVNRHQYFDGDDYDDALRSSCFTLDLLGFSNCINLPSAGHVIQLNVVIVMVLLCHHSPPGRPVCREWSLSPLPKTVQANVQESMCQTLTRVE
jgi:hypothetical protein